MAARRRGLSLRGQLVGALERIESGGAMRVLDALFVACEPESGEHPDFVAWGG